MKNTVADLRRNGYKVRVTHRRWYGDKLRSRHEAELENLIVDGTSPEGNGGMTHVEVTTPNGETLHGVAECSDSQNYDRKLGVYIALGRAMKGRPTESGYYIEKMASYITDNLMRNLHYHPTVGAALDNLGETEYEELEEDIKSAIIGKREPAELLNELLF